MNLRADVVVVVENPDYDAFIVAFAERLDGGGKQLQFQISLEQEWSQSDIDSGMDTYCLLTETGATTYGGVTSWSILDGHLRLELSGEAASELGVDRVFEIRFSADRTAEVKTGLERVLAE